LAQIAHRCGRLGNIVGPAGVGSFQGNHV
jgi:hypothetical protein